MSQNRVKKKKKNTNKNMNNMKNLHDKKLKMSN